VRLIHDDDSRDFLIAWDQHAAEGNNDRSKYLAPAARRHPMTGRVSSLRGPYPCSTQHCSYA
ncbi:MAG: hypothetical protein ACKN9U_26410, partial [Pirellulaceae bacterium]